MDDNSENSSDGEVMSTGPTRSNYLVVVDSEFPRQIQNHPFHPSHPLFLVKSKGIRELTPTIKYLGHPDHLLSLFHVDYSDFYSPCKACQNECRGHVLCCVPCNFTLHVDCLPHKIKHIHRHFFTLTTSIKEEDRGLNEIDCYECDGKINPDEPVYYCRKCYYPLHIGCSSEAIADHDVSDQVLDGVGQKLMAKVILSITNLNKQKKELTALKARLHFLGHQEHLLIFHKELNGDDYVCDACDQDCKTSPILRCANCDFNLHIDCFPALPPTFKNMQCHLHTLTLTDSLASDLSTDEFYCDFCEDERDPKLPVYYCEECSFVAHVTCVLERELPLILAELESTKGDGVVVESVFVDVANDKIEDEDDNLTLAKIEDEVEDENLTLTKIDAEMRKLQLKLEELRKKRAYLSRVI